jgi:GcrA cell cycle regulator
MDWNEERTAQLTKMWLEGMSASQCARQLGGVSRNAVIGKVHRLGLDSRQAPSRWAPFFRLLVSVLNPFRRWPTGVRIPCAP